jgi:hypothetical protein
MEKQQPPPFMTGKARRLAEVRGHVNVGTRPARKRKAKLGKWADYAARKFQ